MVSSLADAAGRIHLPSLTSSSPGYTAIAGSKSAYACFARPDKALIDLAYLHPRADDPAFLQELRPQDLERLDLRSYVRDGPVVG
jgi:hypothetical protein